MDKNYTLGTKVIMKKAHPCGINLWEITRLGADIKLKCTGCGRLVIKKIVEE